MLQSFLINGFRSFSRLEIPQLGAVNLIVGKNNVGKSSLLEALRLYATRGRLTTIASILSTRQEVNIHARSRDEEFSLSSLYHGRDWEPHPHKEILLGPIHDLDAVLRLQLVLLRPVYAGESDDPITVEYKEIPFASGEIDPRVVQGLAVTRGEIRAVYPVRFVTSRTTRRVKEGDPPYIPSNGADDITIARWWDSISLRDGEERVLDCLRGMAPIDRVSLVEHPYDRGARLFMARLHDARKPIPLKSLGDGVSHLFQIAVALESSRDPYLTGQRGLFPDIDVDNGRTSGMLLIDEIENGIHYSALLTLWRVVFSMARLHNLQVFATSHSWDCIEAFQTAAIEDEKSDGTLIRLEKEGNVNRAVLFSEGELSIVTREAIEVR